MNWSVQNVKFNENPSNGPQIFWTDVVLVDCELMNCQNCIQDQINLRNRKKFSEVFFTKLTESLVGKFTAHFSQDENTSQVRAMSRHPWPTSLMIPLYPCETKPKMSLLTKWKN